MVPALRAARQISRAFSSAIFSPFSGQRLADRAQLDADLGLGGEAAAGELGQQLLVGRDGGVGLGEVEGVLAEEVEGDVQAAVDQLGGRGDGVVGGLTGDVAGDDARRDGHGADELLDLLALGEQQDRLAEQGHGAQATPRRPGRPPQDGCHDCPPAPCTGPPRLLHPSGRTAAYGRRTSRSPSRGDPVTHRPHPLPSWPRSSGRRPSWSCSSASAPWASSATADPRTSCTSAPPRSGSCGAAVARFRPLRHGARPRAPTAARDPRRRAWSRSAAGLPGGRRRSSTCSRSARCSPAHVRRRRPGCSAPRRRRTA